jgi:hypothetical protein
MRLRQTLFVNFIVSIRPFPYDFFPFPHFLESKDRVAVAADLLRNTDGVAPMWRGAVFRQCDVDLDIRFFSGCQATYLREATALEYGALKPTARFGDIPEESEHI